MLENMYHKRVSGYRAMGYSAWNENIDEKVDIIFDSHNFLPVFETDMRNASREIVIASPFLRKSRAQQMQRQLAAAQLNGARITVITRPVENYKLADQPGTIALIENLTNAEICIIQQARLHQKFAVIDQNIVWYGSINLLDCGFGEESVMRLENAEVAGELLKITE